MEFGPYFIRSQNTAQPIQNSFMDMETRKIARNMPESVSRINTALDQKKITNV